MIGNFTNILSREPSKQYVQFIAFTTHTHADTSKHTKQTMRWLIILNAAALFFTKSFPYCAPLACIYSYMSITTWIAHVIYRPRSCGEASFPGTNNCYVRIRREMKHTHKYKYPIKCGALCEQQWLMTLTEHGES